MHKLIVIVLLASLLGCKARRELVSSYTTDSLKVTDTWVKQTVVVPGDSVRLVLPLVFDAERPRPAVAETTGNRASLRVEVTGEGMIEASANCDEYEAQVDVLQRTIERWEREVSVFREKETGLQRTIRDLRLLLKLAALALVALAVWKYAKPALTVIETIFKNLKTK